MNQRHHHHQATERDLAALADGSLPAHRRVPVERAVAASPELQASVAEQRRALTAIATAADEGAPVALRARLALAQPAHRRRSRRLALNSLAASTAALATAAIVAASVLGGGASGEPNVAEAAAFATRASLAPAPSHRDDSPLLGVRAAGVPYPYWEDSFGFRAIGIRRDRIDGRTATTVFYRRARRRIAYTIVAGAPLALDIPIRTTTVSAGLRLRSLDVHDRLIVTWLRRGHSCVLSGTGVPLRVLLRLAAWNGGGRIPY
jgi:anti-sigma factor RsiW